MPEERWSVRAEDAYAILGVSPDSDDQAIAAAYRSLARRHHPDIAGEEATRRMSRINAAWDLLRDPAKRETYDRELDAADVAAGRPATRVPRQPARHARQAAARDGASRPGGDAGAGRAGGSARRPSSSTGATEPTHAPYGRTPQRDGTAGAGPPPGRPSGPVLPFGRHLGWSLGEIARVDPGYLEWLESRREGAPYLDEIDDLLVRIGFRSLPKRPRPASAPRRKRRLGRS